MQRFANFKKAFNTNVLKVLILVTLPLLLITSCSDDSENPISASGALKTREIKYDKNVQFNTIELNSGIIGNIEFDENIEQTEVIIETNENILEYVDVVQSGKSLTFKLKDKKYSENITVKCKIKTNKLGILKITGKSNLILDNSLVLDTIKLDISGNSKITGNLICENINLKLSGNSSVNITGNSKTMDLNMSGGSIFEGFEFFVNDFVGDFSGASVGSLSINSKLSLKASGASILNYDGNPEIIKQELSGGSLLNKVTF